MQLTALGLCAILPGVLLILGAVFVPDLGWLGWAWMALLCALALVDGLLGLLTSGLEAHRRVAGRLSRGVETQVTVVLRNRSRRTLSLVARDAPPLSFASAREPVTVRVPGFGEAELSYTTIPRRRGDFAFGDLYVRGVGWLRLSTWQRRLRVPTEVSVYPNFAAIGQYEALARRHRLSDLGMRPVRGRREGTHFESLREYVSDDDFGDIDWKATARRGRPITRQYQAERGQSVMVLLDTGRMMSGQAGDATKLDLAAEAALMLCHVAAARQDAVGLMAFGHRVHSFIAPDKRAGQVRRVLEALYPLQPTLDEPDYAAAFALLTSRARKRALIVVFTDLVDAVASQSLLAHLAALRPRHLPLLVTIRDPDVEALASAVPQRTEDAYQRAIATQVLSRREEALVALRRHGAVVVDAPAASLTAAAVNQYLEIKASGRL